MMTIHLVYLDPYVWGVLLAGGLFFGGLFLREVLHV
jgi:hypothetical protein